MRGIARGVTTGLDQGLDSFTLAWRREVEVFVGRDITTVFEKGRVIDRWIPVPALPASNAKAEHIGKIIIVPKQINISALKNCGVFHLRDVSEPKGILQFSNELAIVWLEQDVVNDICELLSR